MAVPSQSKALIYLIMTLGLVLGFLFSTGTDPAAIVPPLELSFQLSSLQALRGARIDSAVVASDVFTSLRIFGSLPVKAGAEGKSDPFQ